MKNSVSVTYASVFFSATSTALRRDAGAHSKMDRRCTDLVDGTLDGWSAAAAPNTRARTTEESFIGVDADDRAQGDSGVLSRRAARQYGRNEARWGNTRHRRSSSTMADEVRFFEAFPKSHCLRRSPPTPVHRLEHFEGILRDGTLAPFAPMLESMGAGRRERATRIDSARSHCVHIG